MREIKFRVWIPEVAGGPPYGHMMFYQGTQYLGSFLRRANFYASQMEHDKYGIDAEPPKVLLLQFTGLRDKNGKEIYEGDVVQHSEHMKPTELSTWGKLEVKWNEEKLQWDGIFPTLLPWRGIEVIGNIYENPNLLK